MAGEKITLVLDRDEAKLVRTALEVLEGIFGREEADELRAVQELMRKLQEATP